MTKIVAKEQLKQAFQQIVADKKKSEFKIATRQEIAEKEKTNKF